MKYLVVYVMLCLLFIFFMANINAKMNNNNAYEMNNLVILPNPNPASLVQH
jgi:hypothetical protein